MFRQQYCFKSWRILRIYNHMLPLVSLKLGAQLSCWSRYRASHIVLDYLHTRCTISYWSRYRASHIVLDYLHTRCTISYWSRYRASHIVLDYLQTRCTISYWSRYRASHIVLDYLQTLIHVLLEKLAFSACKFLY